MSDVWSLVLIQAMICSVFCSFIAGQKNRDSTGWLVLAFFFGIFALIAVAGLPVSSRPADYRADDPNESFRRSPEQWGDIRRDGNSDNAPKRVSDLYWLGSVVGRLLKRR